MSWVNPSDEDRIFVSNLLESREMTVELARILAVAPKVNSYLMRHLRETFMPESPVKLELLFWHSRAFIHSKNSDFAVMRSGIARALFDEIKNNDTAYFQKIKAAVMELTCHWNEQAAIERDFRWAVAEEDQQVQQSVYQRILKTLTVSESDAQKRELARWAKGLLLSYAPREAEQAELAWLQTFVSASLGLHSSKKASTSVVPPAAITKAIPKGRDNRLAVRIFAGGILFEKYREQSQVIETRLPLPTPLLLRLVSRESDTGEQEEFWQTVGIGTQIALSPDVTEIHLETMDGNHYLLQIDTDVYGNADAQSQNSDSIIIVYLEPDIEKARWIAEQLTDVGLEVTLVEGNAQTGLEGHGNTILLWSSYAEKVWHEQLDEAKRENLILVITDNLAPPRQFDGPMMPASIQFEQRNRKGFMSALLNRCLLNFDLNEKQQQIARENSEDLDAIADDFSQKKAVSAKDFSAEDWKHLTVLLEQGKPVQGLVIEKIKEGFIVDISIALAFLPEEEANDVLLKIGDTAKMRPIDVIVTALRPNEDYPVRVSQTFADRDNQRKLKRFFGEHKEGDQIQGTVSKLLDYGVVLDLGDDVDGFIHIADMATGRVRHPEDVTKPGDQVHARITGVDDKSGNVRLTLLPDTNGWKALQSRYPAGSKVTGEVITITDYGFFVELEPTVTGLVHVSEIDWLDSKIHPTKRVEKGVHVEVMVLDVNIQKLDISLSLKRCTPNPWQEFAERYRPGERLTAIIAEVTPSDIRVELPGKLHGVVSKKAMKDNMQGSDSELLLTREYTIGHPVFVYIEQVDVEKEQILLSIRNDDFSLQGSSNELVEVKLSVAQQHRENGREDLANNLFEEVLIEGNAEQQATARQLINQTLIERSKEKEGEIVDEYKIKLERAKELYDDGYLNRARNLAEEVIHYADPELKEDARELLTELDKQTNAQEFASETWEEPEELDDYDQKLEKAQQYIDRYDFEQARVLLEEIFQYGTTEQHSLARELYEIMQDTSDEIERMEEAAAQAAEREARQSPYDHMLNVAKTLIENDKAEEAKTYLETVRDSGNPEQRQRASELANLGNQTKTMSKRPMKKR